MRTTVKYMTAGLIFALAATSAFADDATAGARLANACTSCHGLEGRSLGAVPTLAGQPLDDLIAKLKAFKEGTAEATIMNRLARGYSDEEIAALAAYFSAVTP